MNRKKKGFTLVELLVTVSLIGLLSSVVLASLNNAKAKARDAQRKTTLNQLSLANELYAASNNGNYVPVQGWFSNRDCVGGNSNINLLTPTYISVVNDDPLHTFQSQPSYLHLPKDFTNGTINTTNCPSLVLPGATKWSFYAKLERPSAADIATMTAGDSYDQCVYAQYNSGYGLNYRVGN